MIMEQTVTIHIPQFWMKGLPEETLTLQHVIRLGIRQYKIERAIQLYRAGVGSVGYLAEQLEISKPELCQEFRQRGIDPEFSATTVQEELGR
jgi:predicted HTH domain antitoxin